MKIYLVVSVLFSLQRLSLLSILRSFKCNRGEEFNTSLSVKEFYAVSITHCGSLCHNALCPTFAYDENTKMCKICDDFYIGTKPRASTTRCLIQPAPATTPAPTTAGPTALPGDTGAKCNLREKFSLYVQATGATFYCCHGWEYKYATHRDLTFFPAILAQECRYKCDIHPTCYSFTYYGNTSCQLSSCSNEISCTKANVTSTDAIWCYY